MVSPLIILLLLYAKTYRPVTWISQLQIVALLVCIAATLKDLEGSTFELGHSSHGYIRS